MAVVIAKGNELKDYEVYRVWNSFLELHGRNSNRTKEEYESRVKEFFNMLLGKDVRFLSKDDIISIKHADIQTEYVGKLLERGNSESTVLIKLRSVRSFYNELLKNDIPVNPMVLQVKLKAKQKHHESLMMVEYLNLLEFMKLEDDGYEKYLLTKTLFHTANRKTATLNMTWEDNFIEKTDALTGEKIKVIKVYDKGGKEILKPISDEFYDELLSIKTSDKVFPVLSGSGAYKRYERSLKKYGKRIGKNLSIHCLKTTALTLGYQMTKDINLCKQLGGHASLSTTEIYIKEEQSLTNQISYNSSKTMDERILEKMSHEELLELINKHQDVKMALMMRAGK